MLFFILVQGGLIHTTHLAMKHILPALTVTALAAAASAQTAPAPAAKQSLSYNRVIVSYLTTNSDAPGPEKGLSVLAQAKLGAGFYVSANVIDFQDGGALFPTGFDNTIASLGYAYTLPSIAGINTDLNVELGYKSIAVGLRALIGGGVEIGVAHTHGFGSGLPIGFGAEGQDILAVSASYNLGFIVKGLSINASYNSISGLVNPDITSIGLGYNF